MGDAVPGDQTHPFTTNEPCEECAAALKRNVLLGIGFGVLLGAAAVFILTR